MPRGDGTGPRGEGAGTGRGAGRRGILSAGQIGKAALLAVIDATKCASCGTCVDACAAGAITLKTIAVVAAAKCTGCGACVDVCGVAAIALKAR